MASWLFTVEKPKPDWPQRVGHSFRVWTLPPRNEDDEELRLRADGFPFEPAWKPGDEVVAYHPDRGRCFALLEIDDTPDWNAKDEVWYTHVKCIAYSDRGPTLHDIGVVKALQGGRHRLDAAQQRRARQLILAAQSGGRL